MTECLHFQENFNNCNCTYEPCSRKGFCCQCIAYHRKHNEIPACYFSRKDEATYNRSIEFFIRNYR
ncbi:MAG: DUF6485 family protein [bacterium]